MTRQQFFSGNRKNLVKSLDLKPGELAIIPAHVRLQKRHDEAYSLTQDSTFYYLSGLREPDCFLILGQSQEILLAPAIEAHHQLWEGQPSEQQLSQISGIDRVIATSKIQAELTALLAKVKTVYTPLPYKKHRMQKYYRMQPNPARAQLISRLRRASPSLKLADLRPAVASLRMIKQEFELKRIQKAIDITLGAIDLVQKQLANFRFEHEIEALLEYEFRRRGGDGPAYGSIVASGANSTQIHYTDNSAKLDHGLILLDVGASFEGYCADISRTIGVKPFSGRAKDIYQAVEELQKFALNLLKPGVIYEQYQQAVETEAAIYAKRLNLPISKNSTIPHMVSHHLGLDVHDAADYDQPLRAGMVLTVEPGLYDQKAGIGVRLEDDVLITKTGCQILSQ